MGYNVAKIKEQFPMLRHTMRGRPLIYLDSAATTQKPQRVINALSTFYSSEYGTVHRAIYELSVRSTALYDESRETVRAFLNAKHSDEIVFTKGTTESINLVASSFGKAFIKPGDEILITEIEHHANIVPWQMLCNERGAILRAAPITDSGELDLDQFASMINDKTRLVSIAHISNSIGTLHPVEEIVRMAHAKGAYVLIDGAQAAANLPIDVQKIDCDFYAFSSHKAFGPTGIGVLYGKRELLSLMPPYQGGGDMIDQVTLEKSTYQDPPLRFEAGTPMIAQAIGLQEALRFIESLGRDAIFEHEQHLLRYTTEKMEHIPHLKIIGNAKQKGGIISFNIDGIHSLDLGTLLDLKGVALRTGHHCAQTAMKRFNISATARISFAPHTTFDEIDLFLEALKEVALTLLPQLSY